MRRWIRRLLEVPYTFVAMNAASVAGLYAFLSNRKDVWVRPSDREGWESVPAPAMQTPTEHRSERLEKAA